MATSVTVVVITVVVPVVVAVVAVVVVVGVVVGVVAVAESDAPRHPIARAMTANPSAATTLHRIHAAIDPPIPNC